MKNRLSDLNNHLFAQLERLGEDLDMDTLRDEVGRAGAIADIAAAIVAAGKLSLEAALAIKSNESLAGPINKIMGIEEPPAISDQSEKE